MIHIVPWLLYKHPINNRDYLQDWPAPVDRLLHSKSILACCSVKGLTTSNWWTEVKKWTAYLTLPYATRTSHLSEPMDIGQLEYVWLSKMKEINAFALTVGNKTVAVAFKLGREPSATGSVSTDSGYLIDRKVNCDRNWAQEDHKSPNCSMIYMTCIKSLLKIKFRRWWLGITCCVFSSIWDVCTSWRPPSIMSCASCGNGSRSRRRLAFVRRISSLESMGWNFWQGIITWYREA